MRTCEECGTKMPFARGRMRHPETGKLVCSGCHPDGKGEPGRPVGLHGSKTINIEERIAGTVTDKPKTKVCPRCNGRGRTGMGAAAHTCWTCNGKKTVTARYGEEYTGPEGDLGDGTSYHLLCLVDNCGKDAYVEIEMPDGTYKPVCDRHAKALGATEEDFAAVAAMKKQAGADGDFARLLAELMDEDIADAWARGEIDNSDFWAAVEAHPNADEITAAYEEKERYLWGLSSRKTAGVYLDCPVCHDTLSCPTHGPVPTAWQRRSSLQTHAHDSGDAETIYHCPFCGSGQVLGGADGTVECDFCHTRFTVQVQPEMAAMPQTVNGEPQMMPGMPGSPKGNPLPNDADPGAKPDAFQPPGAPNAQDQQMGGQPGMAAPAFIPPKRVANKLAWNDGISQHPGEAPSRDCDRAHHSECHGIAMPMAHPEGGDIYPGQSNLCTCDCHMSWNRPRGVERAASKTAALMVTADGVAIPQESYIRHLAIKFADDREAAIAAVKERRDA